MSDIPADIVIYALIAAGLIFWLRNILGTRHGDEPQRPNPFVTKEDDPENSNQKDDSMPAAVMMGTDSFDQNVVQNAIYDPFADEALVPALAVRETLKEISFKDRYFNPAEFIKNAEDAFVMIVEAFAEGDKEFLEQLLSDNVYESFSEEIDRRKRKGESVQTEVHAIRKAQITGAKIEGKMAYISVSIQAEETCVIRDENENILSGNPNRATEVNDMWVFGRAMKSKDPAWRIYETHDGDVSEAHKTPVPETSE